MNSYEITVQFQNKMLALHKALENRLKTCATEEDKKRVQEKHTLIVKRLVKEQKEAMDDLCRLFIPEDQTKYIQCSDCNDCDDW